VALIVTNQTFQNEVLKASKPAVVDVFATWCGPCKMMLPIFEEISKELGDTYTFAKLNIDEERDLAIQYNISSIPTLLFFKGGDLIAKESGYLNKDALTAKIKEHLG